MLERTANVCNKSNNLNLAIEMIDLSSSSLSTLLLTFLTLLLTHSLTYSFFVSRLSSLIDETTAQM